MGCESCRNHEAEYIAEATKESRLMGDMVQVYDRQNRRLWVAVLALAGTLVVTAGCMVWTVTNAQRIANEAMLNALNSVAEIGVTEETTTTTTTVNQDTGEDSGNNVYQAGEYAEYAEGDSE